MIPESLSHYTMEQFLLILFMLILFFSATYTGFISVYYSAEKKQRLSILIPLILLIMNVILIETAYSREMIFSFVLLFRILNMSLILSMQIYMQKNKQIGKTHQIMGSSASIIHIIILILSFTFHYIPLYLTVLPVLLYWRFFQPAKLDILIDKEASDILQNLNEAILIFSADRELLSINPSMETLLNKKNHEIHTIQDISFELTGDKNIIENWFDRASTEKIFFLKNKYYLINIVNILNKGLIITASDIHNDVIVQKELEESITDLENLTKTLQLYSQSSELLGIKEERAMIYRHIQEIISQGLIKLNKDLMEIKQEPPDNYEKILYKSRSLLNEVRAIVTNWRSITGADI